MKIYTNTTLIQFLDMRVWLEKNNVTFQELHLTGDKLYSGEHDCWIIENEADALAFLLNFGQYQVHETK